MNIFFEKQQDNRGFTLVEMAMVLVIVGLLVAAFLTPLSAQMDLQRYSETKKQMEDVKEALYGYAMSHTATDGKPYLPCPDTDGDGAENRTGSACSALEGNIPYASLGVNLLDSWNNNYRYRVTAAFADNATGFTLTTTGGITVKNAVAGTTVASNIPAIIISWGKNGAIVPAAGTDEDENRNGDTNFVTRDFSATFDDVVVWVSPNVLFNRMVAAGKLP